MILHETRDKTEPGQPKPTKLYSASGMAKLVRRLRELPNCRRRSLSMLAAMAE